MARSMPRRTWIVTSPWTKLRLRPRVWRTGSLIAKYLHRVGRGRLPRRIDGGEEAQHQRGDDDRRNFERIGLGRHFGQEAHRRVPDVLAAGPLKGGGDLFPEQKDPRAEQEPGDD